MRACSVQSPLEQQPRGELVGAGRWTTGTLADVGVTTWACAGPQHWQPSRQLLDVRDRSGAVHSI
eukprot:11210781-Lingulodinium_polyedra.AAC.1